MHFVVEIILVVISSVVAFFIGQYFGLGISGYRKRTYCLMKNDFTLNDKTILEIINEFKPIYYQEKNYILEPEVLYYEAIDLNEDEFVLIYRPCWSDEYHPKKLTHYFYLLFRIFYYGSKKDIEFIELVIAKKSLTLKEIRYETFLPSAKINRPIHDKVLITQGKNGLYQYVSSTEKKQLQPTFFQNNRLKVQIITWNHLQDIVVENQGKRFDLPLELLTDRLFWKFKITRRSSGIVYTPKRKIINGLIITLSILLFTIMPSMIYFFVL